MLRTPLMLILSLAGCGGDRESPGVRDATDLPTSAAPERPAAPAGSPTLDAYLAATPREQPILDTAITGVRGDDTATDIARCQKTGWSYHQCDRVFPTQGRQWVRWECMHGDTPHTRSVLCTRLAEYLYAGVGGPREPALARDLFDRQCQPREAAARHNCFIAAATLMFDDPARALGYAERSCDSADRSPVGCRSLLPVLRAGARARSVVVEQVEGLPSISVGSTCRAWLWPDTPGRCKARLDCGDLILYGSDGGVLDCADGSSGGEAMTSAQDGDPSFSLAASRVEVRDDASGRLGAFTLVGKLE